MGYGDKLMAIGEAWDKHQADPHKRRVAIGDGVKVDWCPLSEGLDFLATQTHVDACTPPVTWVHSYPSYRPYIDYGAMQREFLERGGGPIKRRKLVSVLGHYTFKPYTPKPAKLALTPAEEDIIREWSRKPFIAIEPFTKAAAPPSKQWPVQRFQEVALELAKDMRVVQVSSPLHRETLRGVIRVQPTSFRQALAYIGASTLYIGPEGGLHHGAAAFGKPAVVVFGGFIMPESTGYDFHRNLTGGATKSCGTRNQACPHCIAAMEAITPEEVIRNARELLHKGA